MSLDETSLPHSSPSEAEGCRPCHVHPHAGGVSRRVLLSERWKLSAKLLVPKWEFTELTTCCIMIKDALCKRKT